MYVYDMNIDCSLIYFSKILLWKGLVWELSLYFDNKAQFVLGFKEIFFDIKRFSELNLTHVDLHFELHLM